MAHKAFVPLLAIAVLLIISSSVFADTLFMRNGDRIAGEITKVEVETNYPVVEVSAVEVDAEGISAVILSDLSEEEEKSEDILVMKNG
ncbi:MAG: hypothetical protein HWN70_14730, partial [Desulfobacterales bacterium]|nr:hypothetical protein [Desulfobacterales bacterium]